MQYRKLPHGGENISVVGMGAGSLHNSNAAEVERIVEEAIDAGVNLFDFIPSKAEPLEPMARAIARHRADVHMQVHIGACYNTGSYGWTTAASKAIREFESRLALLNTDYADFGFIHCIDEDADLDRNPQAHASDCTGCGHCDKRCPFGVNQSARMQEIAAYFGE